jgi:hypothetical protein
LREQHATVGVDEGASGDQNSFDAHDLFDAQDLPLI